MRQTINHPEKSLGLGDANHMKQNDENYEKSPQNHPTPP